MSTQKHLLKLAFAILATIPGIWLRFSHAPLHPLSMALISGAAIMGAAFLLLWASDAAQADISQALALSFVALMAVLPEYAVDMYFTWQAGLYPDQPYAHYAIANMTGANRLLIGVAWGVIAAVVWFRTRRSVRLEAGQRTELAFLGLATLYAFLIPIKGSLAWYDSIVFLGLYVWYLILAARHPHAAEEFEGPAELLIQLPKRYRRLTTYLLFVFAGGVILASAEPFSEGLVATGKIFNINEFLLVQWLAPIASETPEFVVAIMFASRGKGGVALASLLSAKLNQWTLLVGMIPGVYAIAHRSLEHPLPMDEFQLHEILLTAAQSLLAVCILTGLNFSIRHASLLFVLFAGQLVAPSLVEQLRGDSFLGIHGPQTHQVFSLLYLVAGATLLLDHPKRLKSLWMGLR